MLHRSRFRTFVLALAALPWLVATARAADVTVPAGSTDAVAAAVAEAGPGGTVTLLAGHHVVTTTVVVDVPRVTIEGKRGATILGLAGAGERFVLFEIRAADVTLTRFEIGAVNASEGDLAVAVVPGAHPRLTVSRLSARDVVQLVDGGESTGLDVSRNVVSTVGPTEAGAPTSHLSVIRSAAPGEVRIRKNRLTGLRAPGTVGIEIRPPVEAIHHVEKNRLEGYDTGLVGEGEGRGNIRSNRLRQCGNGILVGQAVTAVQWEIKGNRVDDMLATGIFLGDGDNCRVRRNRVWRCASDGVNVGGVFLDVVRNKTRLNAGIGVFGATNSSDYVRNKGKRCGTGVRVEGSGNRLHRNRGSKNRSDGVVSVGGNVDESGNRGTKNGGVQVSIQ